MTTTAKAILISRDGQHETEFNVVTDEAGNIDTTRMAMDTFRLIAADTATLPGGQAVTTKAKRIHIKRHVLAADKARRVYRGMIAGDWSQR